MSENKEALVKTYNDQEERKFAGKFLDKLEAVEKRHLTSITDFLTPPLQGIAENMLHKYTEITWYISGGSEFAERKRIVLAPNYVQLSEDDINIDMLAFNGDFNKKVLQNFKVTHRDFLGAILALGVKREKIGDLWVTEKGCVTAVASELSRYLQQEPLRIKGVNCSTEVLDRGTFRPPVKSEKIVNTTVSSLRLDAIAAVGFGVSRSSISQDIVAGKIKVNWRNITKTDHSLKKGDVLSGKGRGRVILLDVFDKTRKGRFRVSIQRFI